MTESQFRTMAITDSLRKVLELEQRKGYSDKAVIGGLDGYLRSHAGEIRQNVANPGLLATLDQLNLANPDYGSWDVVERERWIGRLLHWLSQLEKAKGQSTTDLHTDPGSGTAAHPAAQVQPDAWQRKPSSHRSSVGQVQVAIDSPVTAIRGIAPKVATRFAKLGVRTVHDLLYLFPRRYIDYSQRRTIADLEEGKDQTVIADIWQSRVTTFGNRPGTEAIAGDETGNVRLVWFNQPYLAKSFTTNARIVLSGTVSVFKGHKVLVSPEWEFVKDKELIHTGRLVPVYPLTQGLYPRQVRKWTKLVIDEIAWQVSDFLPPEIKSRCELLNLSEAITQIHYPDNQTMAEEARKRLAFDELFLLQLGVLARKRDWQEGQPGNIFHIDQEIVHRFSASLPFALTRAQERVLNEIVADLKQGRAMSRLLQGEVGSGKTVIATLAMVLAVSNGFQAALMAPTEVLAEQHFQNICNHLDSTDIPDDSHHDPHGTTPSSKLLFMRRCAGFLSDPITVALLVGSLSDEAKVDLHRRIAQGKIDVVIGTHAIIQKDVRFNRLGLAVIDEQQRFGVLQRSALRQKGYNPHILIMTATPIPRTMALTLYGDLDLSVIDELPPGRQVVKTKYLEPQYRERAYAFVRRQVSKHRQAFIICPLIEESETSEARAATTEYQRLSKHIFPDLRLGLLHGRMAPVDKEHVMRRFRDGELDILISTSVVEVGIDIPSATVMLVEGADRFGLSQLHQFRGRVGRGSDQSYCVLIPERPSSEASERLHFVEIIHDGFALAEKDLEIRGPGEFFGTLQSGLPDLKIARLSNLNLVEIARREAMTLFQNDDYLRAVEHSSLRQRLSQVWSDRIEWS